MEFQQSKMEIMGLKTVLSHFKGKKVFITGHTGFKGSWLTFLLDQHGAITKGYALETSVYLHMPNNLFQTIAPA